MSLRRVFKENMTPVDMHPQQPSPKIQNDFQIVLFNLDEPFGDEATRNLEDSSTIARIFLAMDAYEPFHNIQNLFRIGSYTPNGKPRHIVLSFSSEAHQQKVLQNAHRLSGISEWKGISIMLYRSLKKDPNTEAPNHDDVEQENAVQLKQEMDKTKQKMAEWLQLQKQEQPEIVENEKLNDVPSQASQQTKTKENITTIHVSEAPPSPLSKPKLTTQLFVAQKFMKDVNQSLTNDKLYPDLSKISEAALLQPQQNIVPNPDVNEIKKNQQNTENNSKTFVKPIQAVTPVLIKNPYADVREDLKKEQPQQQPQQQDEKQTQYQNQLYQSQNFTHFGRKQTLNILVLGETGVGKSTWINGIANYMTYNTLQDAIGASQPICLIPSQFSIFEKDFEIKVRLEPTHGNRDNNEIFSTEGQSATQGPKTYQFETAKYIVNIIDTPGIGDTRGFDYDKENTKNILNALAHYDDLHAICFLYKSNDCRLTEHFKFCISELLLQLHKDAIDNIAFFFTNSRSDFYKPGNTMVLLKAFIAKLKAERGLQISLASDKVFCTDNEAFRMVCAHFNGAKFSPNEFQNYSGSWQQSADETNRFLEFAARQRPYSVSSTLSINKARTIILYLAKPLADVSELIETNIRVYENRRTELISTANNLNELKKKLKISQVGIETIKLDYPKTVCTSHTCIHTIKLPNIEELQTIYDQICHDHCLLENISPEHVREPKLKKCTAMGGKLNCQICKCLWSTHMHIRFDQIKKVVEVDDKNIQLLIQKNKDAAGIKKKMIKNCETIIAELQAEQKKIVQVSLYFGRFLQENAILPYNDAFEQYIEQYVYEEEKCVSSGGDSTKLKNLRKLLDEYRQEKAMLRAAAKNPYQNAQDKIFPNKMAELKTCFAELFRLQHTGKTLQKLFYATEDGLRRHNDHIIVKYVPGENPYGSYTPNYKYF